MLFFSLIVLTLAGGVSGAATFADRLPKFQDPLPIYPVLLADTSSGETNQSFTIYMSEREFQMLPMASGYPPTRVWAYTGLIADEEASQLSPFAPGVTIEATRNVELSVKYVNNISTPHMFAVDPTLHWANPNGAVAEPPYTGLVYNFPVPLAPHVHGIEVASNSDGHPDTWFTFDGIRGPQVLIVPISVRMQLLTFHWASSSTALLEGKPIR